MPDRNFVVKNGLQVNTAFVANSSGLYFSGVPFSNSTVANAAVFANNSTYLNGQLASYYAQNSAVAQLSGGLFTGSVNATSYTIGSTFSANSTLVNAASYTISTAMTANILGIYHVGTVNVASFSVGTSFTANSTLVNAVSYTIGSSLVANTLGIYHSGLVNASSFSVGATTIANSTGLYGTLQTVSQPNITANNSSFLGGTAASGYQTTAGLSANVATLTSNNSLYLGGTIASGYQTALGFTPIQQGGGTSQTTNKLYIGWSAGSVLRLQVDATDYGSSWPISVTGSAATFTSTSQNSQFNSMGVGTAASGTAGEIRATNNITAYYSDKRLKKIISNIPSALEKVNQLSGVIYINNEVAESFGYDDMKEQVGVIAQEVENVLPQIVKLAPFDTEYVDGKEVSKSGENYKTVQYEKLIPLLIEAIKELRTEVEALKKDR